MILLCDVHMGEVLQAVDILRLKSLAKTSVPSLLGNSRKRGRNFSGQLQLGSHIGWYDECIDMHLEFSELKDAICPMAYLGRCYQGPGEWDMAIT